MRLRRPLLPTLAGTLLSMLPLARFHAESETDLRDASARVERIRAGVYAILHDDAIVQWPTGATGWPHGNTG